MSKGPWVYAYARAAFLHAKEKNSLTQWQTAMAGMAALTADNRFRLMQTQPDVTREMLVDLLVSSCDASIRADAERWLWQLVQHKRLAALPAIYDSFVADYHRDQGVVSIKVVSASKLKKAHREKLEAYLADHFKAEVEVEYREDESVLGGLSATAGSTVIDATLSRRLARLAKSIQSAT